MNLRESVFYLCDEAEAGGLLSDHADGDPHWLKETADAEVLAWFMTDYGGKTLDGKPDLLHGVPEADLVPHCRAWLEKWRADDAAGEHDEDGDDMGPCQADRS